MNGTVVLDEESQRAGLVEAGTDVQNEAGPGNDPPKQTNALCRRIRSTTVIKRSVRACACLKLRVVPRECKALVSF